MKSLSEVLKNPAVYAAVAGLASAIGWEIQDSHIIDHILGGVGALAGLTGIILASIRSKHEPKP